MLKMYGNFLKEVINEPTEGSKHLDKYFTLFFLVFFYYENYKRFFIKIIIIFYY